MLFTLIALAAVTWASLTSWLPELPYVVSVPFYDKWVHFVTYAALSLAIQIDYLRHLKSPNPQKLKNSNPQKLINSKTTHPTPHTPHRILYFFAVPALWGVLMELAQAYLTTYRTGDAIDALANSVGAALGLLFSYPIFHIFSPKTPPKALK